MKKLICFFFLVVFQFSLSAFAGWSSGGGNLTKNSQNPWFLNNTTHVRYCVLVDEKNFGASTKLIHENIEKAIAYWKSEFPYAVLPEMKKLGRLGLATQTFEKVDCDDETDIRLQFGVLSEKQSRFLKTPRESGAVTVRTHYSEESLRAKGFLYFSPARGPLAYDLPGTPPDVWEKNQGALLYLTLVHEFGHVFGLNHFGTNDQLMSEGFVQRLLLKGTHAPSWVASLKNYFSLPSGSAPFCWEQSLKNIKNAWIKALGLQPDQVCMRAEFSHGVNQLSDATTVIFFAGSSATSLKKIGTAVLTTKSKIPVNNPTVWLTDKQQVFSPEDLTDIGFKATIGAGLWTAKKYGKFKSIDGKINRSMIFTFTQGNSFVGIDGSDENGDLFPLVLLGL